MQRPGVRTRIMDALQLNGLGIHPDGPVARARNLGIILRYALDGHHSRKRRTPVDVKTLVDKWIEAIVGMCLAHDKAGFDANDAKADELLGPLLAAPVKQLREFYHALVERMNADSRVPWLVKMAYEAWGEVMVKNAPDEGVKRLKKKLAGDIAELVEGPVADQLPNAIKRALQWRDEKELVEVKEALQEGAKPKLVGRQSCLFLECRRGKKKVSVMI